MLASPPRSRRGGVPPRPGCLRLSIPFCCATMVTSDRGLQRYCGGHVVTLRWRSRYLLVTAPDTGGKGQVRAPFASQSSDVLAALRSALRQGQLVKQVQPMGQIQGLRLRWIICAGDEDKYPAQAPCLLPGRLFHYGVGSSSRGTAIGDFTSPTWGAGINL